MRLVDYYWTKRERESQQGSDASHSQAEPACIIYQERRRKAQREKERWSENEKAWVMSKKQAGIKKKKKTSKQNCVSRKSLNFSSIVWSGLMELLVFSFSLQHVQTIELNQTNWNLLMKDIFPLRRIKGQRGVMLDVHHANLFLLLLARYITLRDNQTDLLLIPLLLLSSEKAGWINPTILFFCFLFV